MTLKKKIVKKITTSKKNDDLADIKKEDIKRLMNCNYPDCGCPDLIC
jgi:hypothetical protein